MNDMTLPNEPLSVSRRGVLAGGASLIISFTLGLSSREAAAAGVTTPIGAFIEVTSANTVNVLVASSEMGQGIMTGLAQLVAEELMVDWSQVTAQHAPPGWAYANPLFGIQLTAGSSSIRGWFTPLRTAAATAREMLITAGATALNAPRSSCVAQHGTVRVTGTNRSVTYGQIAAAAAQVPPPSNPPLVSNFRLIGTPQPRLDIPSKVDGSAVYGIDVRLPGMLHAVIKHCPTLGGTVAKTPAKPAGAIAVVNLGDAVAVVAANTGLAKRLSEEMNVQWSIPATSAQLDSALIQSKAQQLLANGTPQIAEQNGAPDAELAKAAHRIDATYSLPYLAHACLEPLNCTASVTANACKIWAPNQSPMMCVFTAQGLTGLSPDKITVTTTFLGGGLGRKFEQDYIAQAIKVSQAMKAPVKVTWPREQDFTNDQYRPMALVKVDAGTDSNGQIRAWIYRNVSPSIMGQRNPGMTDIDTQATEGSDQLAYGFASRRVEYVKHPAAVPVGFWRSVGHSINCFAVESAIDELALAAGQDPYAFRRKHLAGNARALAVLDAAAKLGNWSVRPLAGHARGIAYSEAFGSLVAQVVEISAPTASAITVHKVACAIDCGMAVNPDQVTAQMEGGILHGLSAAMWGHVTFSKGVPSPSNFNRYRLTRMREMPVISVQIVNSGGPLGGAGEPGVPPIAPAVANAYARLTGKRLRNLPFFPTQSFMSDD